MDSYFAKFGSDHSVGARQVDVTASSQRNPRRCQDILLLEPLHKFCDFFFGHLQERG